MTYLLQQVPNPESSTAFYNGTTSGGPSVQILKPIGDTSPLNHSLLLWEQQALEPASLVGFSSAHTLWKQVSRSQGHLVTGI